MIVDMMRIPTDKYGVLLYDFNNVQKMIEQYKILFPTHEVIAMPAQIKIWEDLKLMRQFLDEIITSKEIEENDL